MLVHFFGIASRISITCPQCDERKYVEPLQIGYWSRKGRFKNLEQRVGDAEVVATEKSMREAMNEEVCLTLDVQSHSQITSLIVDDNVSPFFWHC